ncbi:MAG: exodeoxyribonuclease VII large subunit [Longimicrobiales bacterium]|nr:exodeoxyribonuclease VII large subunit [Longimicrobiales bacterium]
MSDDTLDLFAAEVSGTAPEGTTEGATDDATDGADHEASPVLTVTQVNRRVRRLLESRWGEIDVAGEVGGWTRHRSGHCYFGIKDESAQLDCVIFRDDARQLPIDPEVGMEIRVTGRLTLYEPQGRYQFVARRVVPLGDEGFFQLAFETLRLRLTEEGLIDPARRRPIPRVPRRVGVVTSTTGAALRDILKVIARRAPWTEVVVAGARVQGEGASREIARALERIDRVGDLDVVIVGRGGGSLEDLWAFNEEPVARAIAACSTPVISAVGHETDHTIADLVADLRAPTPSAAAEAAVPDGDAIAAYIQRARRELEGSLRRWVERREVLVDSAPHRLARSLERRLDPARQRVRSASQGMRFALRGALDRRRQELARGDRLEAVVRGRLERIRARLHRAAARLDALSPLATLERGFAVPVDAEGTILRRVEAFVPGSEFHLHLVDGRVRARVEAREPGE